MLLRLDAQFFHLFTGLQDYEENLICMNMTKIQPSFFFFFFFATSSKIKISPCSYLNYRYHKNQQN